MITILRSLGNTMKGHSGHTTTATVDSKAAVRTCSTTSSGMSILLHSMNMLVKSPSATSSNIPAIY